MKGAGEYVPTDGEGIKNRNSLIGYWSWYSKLKLRCSAGKPRCVFIISILIIQFIDPSFQPTGEHCIKTGRNCEYDSPHAKQVIAMIQAQEQYQQGIYFAYFLFDFK